MKRNPGSDGTNGQNGNQQSGEMAAPEPASKRDAQEAERKAEEAKMKATEEAERVASELREELQEAKEEIEELREVTRNVDKLVNAVYKKGATRKGEPPLNQDMPCMHPENKDVEQPAPVGVPDGETDA